jgi:hypothetical protein
MKIEMFVLLLCSILLSVIFSGCIENHEDLQIKSFIVDPVIIDRGDKVTLSWVVIGANNVSIDNGIGYVNSVGDRVLIINETTTFTLTAKNKTRIVTASSKVIVKDSSSNNSIIIDDELYDKAPRDYFDIEYLRIYGDYIEINVVYSGGCEDHDFKLISKEYFMESEPVQIDCVLSHEDNDDPCDSIVMETLLFNLTPLKIKWQNEYQMKSGKIIMLLEIYNYTIIYIFGDEHYSFLDVNISTDKTFYESDENISIMITLTNKKDNNVTLEFPDSQIADYEVLNEQGDRIFLWSFDKGFADVITPVTILSGETLEIFSTKWYQIDNAGFIVPSGNYSIRGWIPGFYYSDDDFQYVYSPGPIVYGNQVEITLIG